MAQVVILYNPLDTSRRRRVALENGVRLIEWADLHEPAPKECTRDIWVNGRRCEDAEYVTKPGDEILIAFQPGTLAEVGYAILQALVAAAISYVVGRIFGPSKPKSANTPSPSQVYGIAPSRNAARLGEPIPAAYGNVILLPDYAAQPYVEFVDNEQRLFALLCLGLGEFVVHEMLLGDSSASLLTPEVALFQIFGPADHGSTFGTIQAASGVRENVVTSADVADQELLAPNEESGGAPSTWYWEAADWASTPTPPPAGYLDLSGAANESEMLALMPANPTIGDEVDAFIAEIVSGGVTYYYTIHYIAAHYSPGQVVPDGSLIPAPGGGALGATKWIGPFETCKAGQQGISLELDFIFGAGLYSMDGSGNLADRTVTFLVERRQIDDNGNPIAAPIQNSVTFTAKSNTAQRYTHKIPVTQGRYTVKVARVTPSAIQVNTVDRGAWTGLKFELVNLSPGAEVYGNVTLAAVRLRASNGVASDAASSIRFRVTRKLPPPSGGAVAATVNPADVFADIVTAAYGGNRPRNGDELDLAELEAARLRWSGHNGFNAIFDQPSTVWEALSLSVQTVGAAPLPVGSRMTVIQDGVQPVRAQMFTDANIVAGSLQITYAFDRDGTPHGVRVEYRDPRTFSAAAYLLPVGAPDYESVSLFGCTDSAVAAQHARLIDNRRRLQRTNLVFVTELEGLSCLPGDRIGVQASMPRWAQGARVVRVTGLVLELDAALLWTAGQSHALQLRDPEGHPHKVAGVTPGASSFHVVLPSLPFEPVGYDGDMEPTTIAFGVDGQEITDWTVATMRPEGERVVIEAVNYNPAVWANTAAHLLDPLPFDEDKR
jgi:hypothetical protein